MKFDPLLRIRFLAFCFFAFAAILTVRLFIVQVIRGEEFNEMALRQYTKPMSDIFGRGSIYFTEKGGNVISAAALKSDFILTVNPTQITDAEKIYEKISSFINVAKDDFIKKATKEKDTYEIIGPVNDEAAATSIRALGISGLSIYREKTRYYPSGSLGSHVLGIVAQNKDDGEKFIGRYGLEKQYETVLHRDNESVYVNFFAEAFSSITKTIMGNSDSMSGDIVTNIEPGVENILAKELASVQEKWKGRSTGGIVMDPVTGRVIAMSALPDFDPNNFGKEKSVSVFRNPLVEDVFEMGSIIKPLTVAAGLDANVIKADTTYNDLGYVIVNGRRIENFDGKGRGITTMQSALGNSLNTGMVYIMQQLGRQKFSDYMLSFGFGDPTGIDLPNEAEGLVNNLSSKYEVDYATVAFGQGIAVTPIATARALSSLANGGMLVTPSVGNEIRYRIGTAKNIGNEDTKRVISKKTSDEITRMLVKVVDENLLGGEYKLKNYSVAAKTGTALLLNGSGGYYDDRFIHTFFGYFPAYDPKFLVFLYTVDPKEVEYASHSLTEPFFNIAKFLISYYELPPDR